MKRKWSGGETCSQYPSGEYYGTGSYSFITKLTDWLPLVDKWNRFETWQPVPVTVRLHVYSKGKHAGLSLMVDGHFVRKLPLDPSCGSIVGAFRRADTVLLDQDQDLVREALVAFYSGKLQPRVSVLTINGERLATFVRLWSGEMCGLGFPESFYITSTDRIGRHSSLVDRRSGGVTCSSNPEVRRTVDEMLAALP